MLLGKVVTLKVTNRAINQKKKRPFNDNQLHYSLLKSKSNISDDHGNDWAGKQVQSWGRNLSFGVEWQSTDKVHISLSLCLEQDGIHQVKRTE